MEHEDDQQSGDSTEPVIRRSSYLPADPAAETSATDESDTIPADTGAWSLGDPLESSINPDPLAAALAEQTSRFAPTQSIPVSQEVLPPAPTRQSRSDAELAAALTAPQAQQVDTLSKIEQLQSELELRQREADEYRSWENDMMAIGTPAAIRAVDRTRPEFAEVVAAAATPAIEPDEVESDAVESDEGEPDEGEPEAVESAEFVESADDDANVITAGDDEAPYEDDDGAVPDESVPEDSVPEDSVPDESDESDGPDPHDFDALIAAAVAADAAEVPVADTEADARHSSDESLDDLDAEPVVLVADLGDPGVEAMLTASPIFLDLPIAEPVDDAPDPVPVLDDLSLEGAPSDELGQTGAIGIVAPTSYEQLIAQLQSEAVTSPLDDPDGLDEPDEPDEPDDLDERAELIPASTFDDVTAAPDATDEDDAEFAALIGGGAVVGVTALGAGGTTVVDPDATVQADLTEAATPPAAAPVADAAPVAAVTAVSSAAPTTSASAPRAFSLEVAGLEPTPLEQRLGKSARLFWLWFGVNASLVSVAAGAALFGLGLSLRQTVLAALVGIALSFLPLSLGTLAGKWSGQPTMVVSRATFGLVGNIVPAILAVISRLFWAVVLLWLLSSAVTQVFVVSGLTAGLTETQILVIAFAVSFVLTLVVAFFGYHLIVRMQLGIGILSGILAIGFVIMTADRVDLTAALSTGDGSWILLVTGSISVFSLIGLAWAQSTADLARYQRPSSSGAAGMLSASFGATVPAFLLLGYGGLLAASNPDLASGLQVDPVGTLATLLPSWYPIPLLAAISLSLLSSIALSIYSGAFALQSAGVRISRQSAVLPVALVVAIATGALLFTSSDFASWVIELATVIAVPVAAWVGIFGGEMMLRVRRFDSRSLLRRGGSYPDVRVVNLVALVVATAIGYGFTHGDTPWLAWQGYLFRLFDASFDKIFVSSDVGVIIALALGLITPVVFGVRAIRRQEAVRHPIPVDDA